jgi:hypothetical protein
MQHGKIRRLLMLNLKYLGHTCRSSESFSMRLSAAFVFINCLCLFHQFLI